MEKVLAGLLERLVVIARTHGEVEDTEVRERLDDAVHHGFLIPTPGYQLPETFAMYSREGNRAVRGALAWFLPAATAAAAAEGLDTFHKRLAAFQNLGVRVGSQRVCYNDFFGWANPERYDGSGTVIPRGAKPAEPGTAWAWAGTCRAGRDPNHPGTAAERSGMPTVTDRSRREQRAPLHLSEPGAADQGP